LSCDLTRECDVNGEIICDRSLRGRQKVMVMVIWSLLPWEKSSSSVKMPIRALESKRKFKDARLYRTLTLACLTKWLNYVLRLQCLELPPPTPQSWEKSSSSVKMPFRELTLASVFTKWRSYSRLHILHQV
jgi:hypothetical protein